VPLYLGGIALYSLAVYGAYVWISTSKSIHREPVQAKALNEQEDISYVYDTIAKKRRLTRIKFFGLDARVVVKTE
jgi:hypothetical protein